MGWPLKNDELDIDVRCLNRVVTNDNVNCHIHPEQYYISTQGVVCDIFDIHVIRYISSVKRFIVVANGYVSVTIIGAQFKVKTFFSFKRYFVKVCCAPRAAIW